MTAKPPKTYTRGEIAILADQVLAHLGAGVREAWPALVKRSKAEADPTAGVYLVWSVLTETLFRLIASLAFQCGYIGREADIGVKDMIHNLRRRSEISTIEAIKIDDGNVRIIDHDPELNPDLQEAVKPIVFDAVARLRVAAGEDNARFAGALLYGMSGIIGAYCYIRVPDRKPEIAEMIVALDELRDALIRDAAKEPKH